jgi:hypothetical protein
MGKKLKKGPESYEDVREAYGWKIIYCND